MLAAARVCGWAAVLLTLLLASCISAFEIRGSVHPTGSVTEKVPPIKVLLSGDDGEQATFTRWDGSFVFRDVSPGRYVVDIPSETYLFSQFKLDVAEDGLIRALEYKYPGAPKARADYPLMAESLTTINYFEQREKFNLLGLLMNPSFLTIIVPIGLLYILPKLSAGMDPEELKKAQEEMGGQNPGDLLSSMLGGGQAAAEDSDDD